jgi:hypothetical protein
MQKGEKLHTATAFTNHDYLKCPEFLTILLGMQRIVSCFFDLMSHRQSILFYAKGSVVGYIELTFSCLDSCVYG